MYESPVAETDRFVRYDVTLRDDRGLEVQCLVQVPRNTERPRTALLVMAGVRTGRRALEYLEDLDEFVLISIDYPYKGKRSKLGPWEFIRSLPRIRRAVLNTPAAAMLLRTGRRQGPAQTNVGCPLRGRSGTAAAIWMKANVGHGAALPDLLQGVPQTLT